MRTVFKYPWSTSVIGDTLNTQMPRGAKPLYVAEQYGALCIWVLCNPDVEMVGHRFHVVGTGHPIGDEVGPYVGTAIFDQGALVLHVFDLGETI